MSQPVSGRLFGINLNLIVRLSAHRGLKAGERAPPLPSHQLVPVALLGGGRGCAFGVAPGWVDHRSAPRPRRGRIIAVLVEKEGRARVVAHDLAVGGRRALHAAVAAGVGGADARVAAGRPGPAAAVHVDQVAVEDGPVGRGADRLAVQLHLLLGVPQLQRAGALVGRRLLAVGQGDGGGQVDLVLHVGVGGLEAAESVPLHKWGGGEPLPGLRGVYDLHREESGAKTHYYHLS